MPNPPNKQQEVVMSEIAGLLVPSKGRHAVQQFTLAAEFLAQLSPEDLAEVSKHYEKSEGIKKWFSRKTEERGVAISVSGGTIDVKNTNDLTAVNYERIVADGTVEWSLSVKRESIFIVCRSYTRWKEISTQALALLTDTLKALPTHMIGVAGLQYVDEFFWNGEKEEFRAHLIFDQGSPLLPPSAFRQTRLWHNHSGWFDTISDPQPCKTLTNVNVNVLEQPNRLVIQVITVHKATLSLHVAASQIGNLTPIYEKLHEENKAQLGLLLNETARKLIVLDTSHAAS